MAREKRKFTYKGRSAEQVQKMAKGGGDFDTYIRDDVPLYKVTEGEHCIRILPATWENPEDFAVAIWVHYNVGPEENSYLCLRKMHDEHCPVCDEQERAKREGDEELAYNLLPTKRFCIWLIDRDKESEGPILWAAPQTMINNINKICFNKRTGEVIQVDNPEEGYDIIFERNGSGLKSKYEGIRVDTRPSPIHDNVDQEDKWLDYIMDNPIPEVLVFKEADYLAKLFVSSTSRSSDYADAGSSRRSSRSIDEDQDEEDMEKAMTDDSRRGSRTVDEEEDKEPPFEQDEEQEQEKEPRRSSRRRLQTDDTDKEEASEEKTTGSRRRGLSRLQERQRR